MAVLFLVFIALIRSILLPFVLGILTAYFLDPVTDKLQKNGLSRGVATAFVTALFFIGVGLLLTLAIPVVANQLSGLVAALPDYLGEIERAYKPQFNRWLGTLPHSQMAGIKDALAESSAMMVKYGADFITGIFASGIAIMNIFSLILITPVVTFYLLRDWDKILARLDGYLPRPHAATIRGQCAIIDDTLAGFLRGQTNVCLIMAVFYAACLSAVGLKFSIVIGLATGALLIVPYAGFALGMLVGMSVAFFQFDSSTPLLVVLSIFLTGQLIESYFLTPNLVGNKVGLHPVWIIFGMLAGGALFGFVGVLLAIPLTAVIGVGVRFALQVYLQSGFYKGEAITPLRLPPQ